MKSDHYIYTFVIPVILRTYRVRTEWQKNRLDRISSASVEIINHF